MSAPKNMAGVSVQCAACEAEHTVPVRLELKRERRPQHQQSESQSDVQHVPVGRTNEVQCPKCGYMSPPVLARCPQCQNYLHKGAIIRQQCIAVAKVIVIIWLGWLLAAYFARISDFMKGLFGAETIHWNSPSESPSNSVNVNQDAAVGIATVK